MTHTYALMEVSQNTFDEIKQKLQEAGYTHAILREEPNEHLDMHGIALALERKPRVLREGSVQDAVRDQHGDV